VGAFRQYHHAIERNSFGVPRLRGFDSERRPDRVNAELQTMGLSKCARFRLGCICAVDSGKLLQSAGEPRYPCCRVQNGSDIPVAFGVTILAAGSSRRMGRPKLLLPWGDSSVLGHLIRSWQQLQAAQIAVVCSQNLIAIQEELNRLRFPEENRIFNPAPDRGMFSSIQCAAAWPGWSAGLTHWIITLGDQPQLRRETLQALLDFGATQPDKICQPLRNGRRRHPVLLPEEKFLALKNSTASDLKQFLAEQPGALAGFESADAGLDLDMDTMDDYERARRYYFEVA